MRLREWIVSYSKGNDLWHLWLLYRLRRRTHIGPARNILTFFISRIAHRRGGYIGKDAVIHGIPILPHGLHGVYISRFAEIGRECWIYQNVTIGEVGRVAPKIGDRCLIGAGAVVVGGITIGNDVNIGAGAVVSTDIPDGCTVTSQPARVIVKHIGSVANGDRVDCDCVNRVERTDHAERADCVNHVERTDHAGRADCVNHVERTERIDCAERAADAEHSADTGRAWIEIDKAALRHNVDALRSVLPNGCDLMPAVKANAYGHGAVLISKELNAMGVTSFCVAAVSEGVELRKAGIKGEILILGYTSPEKFALLSEYDLTQTVVDASYAKLLNAYGAKLKVHLKIDTGMRRLGERAENTDAIRDMFEFDNLIVEGMFTHLCSAETKDGRDADFTLAQARAFFDVIAEMRGRGYSCGKTHLLASYGLLNYPEIGGDYARVGIALYGVLSHRADQEDCHVELRPVMSLKARVSLVRTLNAGETAGYGRGFTADGERKIAVLSVGYADGVPRALSRGCGKVLIRGKEAPTAGNICMDQMLVDVTGIEGVEQGDVAVLIGKSGDSEITVYDLAEASGTITNELLSRMGSRPERFLI